MIELTSQNFTETVGRGIDRAARGSRRALDHAERATAPAIMAR